MNSLGSLIEMQFLASNVRVSDSVGKGSKFAFLTGLQVMPWTFLVAQTVKHLPTMQETQVRSLGREGPLEKEMAAHSSVLAWKIPWMEEPGGLQSVGSQRVRHD